MAITNDGGLYSWGRNKEGQLGLGDTTCRKAPTKVVHMEQKQVATQQAHELPTDAASGIRWSGAVLATSAVAVCVMGSVCGCGAV